jgi:3-hydroxyacyl-[acyl-carrier-protein] dehydratase
VRRSTALAGDVAITEMLPHRPPFLLVDRVLVVEAGARAVSLKCLTSDDSVVGGVGHLPSILLAEVMVQTAGIAAAKQGAPTPGMVARIDRFRSRGDVLAGRRLITGAKVVRRFGPDVMVRAVVHADGQRWAAAEIVLHLG